MWQRVTSSKLNLAIFVSIFAIVGVAIIINSRAAISTTCPNLAIGDCRPYDDQSPYNQPIPAYDSATGLSTDGKNTVVWDKTKTTSFTNQLNTIGLPLTSNFDPSNYGCTPGVFETNDQHSINPNDYYDKQKYTDKANFLVQNSNVQVTGYSYSRIMQYNTPYAIDDGGGDKDTDGTALVPVTANVAADDCDGQTVFWNPMTGVEWGFWLFDANSKTGSAIPYNYNAANGHQTHTTAGYMGRFGDGGGRGAGITYFAGLVRKWEIKQKKIEHALSFAFDSPAASYVYPAGKSDGAGGTTIPEGTRFQLDPTLTDNDLSVLGCTKACLTIAHALQQYGMYTIDNSGSSKIYLETLPAAHWPDSDDDGVNDTKDADVAQVASLGTNLPKSLTPSNNWNKFRVVAEPCRATSTSNCPTTQGAVAPAPPQDQTAPSAPANLQATLDSTSPSSQVTLTWNASTDDIGVTGYKISYGQTTLTTTGATYKVTGLSPSTAYSFTVVATDASGKTSQSSNTASVTTSAAPDTTAPSPAPALSSTTVSTSSVGLSWTSSSDNVGVTSYKVLNGTTQVYSGTANIYTVTGLTAATKYTFTVKAYDAAGNNVTSNALSVTTQALADQTAPSVSITNPVSDGQTVSGLAPITVDAADASGISKVTITIDGQVFAVMTAPTSGTKYTPQAWNTALLVNGSGHTVSATATDNSTTQNTSQPATRNVIVNNTDTTPPSPAPVLTASATSDTSINLSWTSSSDNVGVAKYIVQRNGVVVKELGGSTLSYSDSGLVASTTYSYKVIAQDAALNNTGSNTVSTTTQNTPSQSVDTTKPSVPTNVKASAITTGSSSQVNLTWSASTDTSGIQSYTVYRNGTTVATIQSQASATQSWAESSLTPETAYTYTVSATDNFGNASDQSSATIVTTPPIVNASATLTFIPTDDTNIDSGAPNTPLGDRSTINVKSNTPKKYGLLKFKVTGVGTRTITSAKLKLYVNNDSNYGGAFYRTTSTSWVESNTSVAKGVTWNTKPGFDSKALTTLGKVNLNTTYAVDLTSLFTGDGTYGILINSTSLDNVGYNTKNNSSNKPQLILGVQ